MDKWKERLKRIAPKLGYPIFYLFCLVIFLSWTFPYEKLKDRIVTQFNAQQRNSAHPQELQIDDLDSYRAGLQRGRALGFTTAACIHPLHVPIINEEYGASAAELDRARRLIAAFEAADAGAVAFEGSMVDLPVVERARRLVARAATWQKTGA